MEFTGHFETHLTVLDRGARDMQGWADAHGVKYSRIVLDRGRTPEQPMLTVQGRGTLADQRAAAARWVQRLTEAGFPVIRIKIEASPFNADIPRSTEEADRLPAACYFEHHLKFVLGDDADVALATEASQGHAAHLSRNARRTRPDGRHERFVTQRCRGVGEPEARARLDALVAAMARAGFVPIEVEREFVLVDDHPELDLGWIDESSGRSE